MRLGATSLSITKPLGFRSFLDFGTYVLSSGSNVNEGDTLTVYVNTIGVPSGTVLYWETTNITTSDSDFTTTSGSVQIINGTGYFTVGAVADSTTEGAETFGITLRRSSPTGPIVASTTNKTINDTSLSPSYSASSPSSVNEGSALVCTVTTANVADGTTLYWTTSHTSTTDADFTANSGSFTITSNSGTFNVTPTADATTEGAETFTVQIRTGSTSGTIVATLPSVTVNDTSLTPTYSFSSASSVDEGASLACTVTTTNVADSTTLYWTINHTTTSAADFTSTSGSFTVTSNTGTFNIAAASDTLTSEGAETFTVEIRTGSTSGTIVETSSSITVNDVAGWDINNATYDSQSSTNFGSNNAATMSGDGTKVYFSRRIYSNALGWHARFYQYTLNTPWSLASTTFDGYHLVGISSPQSMKWKSDGTKFYRAYGNGDTIRQWSVPSADAWNQQSTNKSYDGQISVPNIGNGLPRDIAWSGDGTKFFVWDYSNARVLSYSVSTAWDVLSTLTYTGVSSTLSSTYANMDIKPDGTKFYFADNASPIIYQHNLTTAFDVSTISTTPTYTLNINSQTGSGGLRGIMIKPDGSEMFTQSYGTGKLYKYTL